MDGTGPTARFNKPWGLTIDEEGQLVVADFANEDNVRVVEASLVPPARMAAKETAGDKALRAPQNYGKLLEDPIAADVAFVVDG